MNSVHQHRSAWIGGIRLPRSIGVVGTAAALGLVVAACESSSSPSTPSQTTFAASMTDPAGDMLPDARVSKTPDLLSGNIQVDATTLRFQVTLAESSIDLPTAFVMVNLDLDQNAATGIQGIQEQVDIGVMGAEAVLIVLDGLQRAQLLRCNGPSCQILGSFPTTFAGGLLQGSIPMSAIADDGRMNAKISTFVAVNNVGGRPPTDVMPNVGQPPAAVR